ncbi:MAG: ATP-binding protein [Pseudomonadota bacterium]|nr:ATP-binding protein [Pseudomonadota bacterium]
MDFMSLQVNYHAMAMLSPSPVILLDLENGRIADVNRQAGALWGRSPEQLIGIELEQLGVPQQQGGDSFATVMARQVARTLAGDGELFRIDMRRADGGATPCEVLLVPIPGRHMLHMRLVDISRRVLADQLRDGQARLLELIARNAPLDEILDSLMRLIERQSAGVLCSVLLLDEDGKTVHPAAGASLPAAYSAALDGVQIGPGVGSCGDAMYRSELVIVPDIQTDPRWRDYRALAGAHGLRACWSTPILLEQQVLGSFAMYYREVRSPGEDELHLIAVATHLAAIAIERTRRERELAQHREHLEELVAARTAELTASMQRADQINRELSSALETLSLAQDELVRRDKMAALGALVAGVAHELNTPIGNSLVVATSLAERTRTLQANLADGLRRSVLERYLADAGEAGELLSRNLKRAATLVAGFKQIAVDHRNLERREFSLTGLLSDLAAPLRVAAKGARVKLELALADGLAMDSYPGPLSQVVTELFENCLAHAFPDGRGGGVRIAAALRSRELLAISVEDDGDGMAPQVQAHVYDPFYTTRMGSGRSGLGLHVAHNIVSGILGGKIELRSAAGEGACFTLLLPVTAPAGVNAAARVRP